jgi:phospholipase C
MADIQHVVVVLMENRSFDELFGTFPGVRGLNESSPAIPQPFPQPDGSVIQAYPFRMSTFTSTALLSPHFGHDWNTMHAAISSSQTAVEEAAKNPQTGTQTWIAPTAANPEDNCGFGVTGGSEAVVGYYAADDLPYLWALAENFGLCDNFFCSSLAGTFPNRLYLTGGTINANPTATVNAYTVTNENDPPVLGNIAGTGTAPIVPNSQVPWGSYLSDLMAAVENGSLTAPVPYTVYDDWQWLPPEINDALYIDQAHDKIQSTLNQFWYYNDSLGVGGIDRATSLEPISRTLTNRTPITSKRRRAIQLPGCCSLRRMRRQGCLF